MTKSQKAQNKKTLTEWKTLFSGNPKSEFHRNLNIEADSFYEFKLIDSKDNLLKMVSVAQTGAHPCLEKLRNKNNGLVLGLDIGNLEFTVLSAAVREKEFLMAGIAKTSKGIISGILNAKGIRQSRFLFIPVQQSPGWYFLYLPFISDYDLEAKYLAGELDKRLEYLYRRTEGIFSNGTVTEDIFK